MVVLQETIYTCRLPDAFYVSWMIRYVWNSWIQMKKEKCYLNNASDSMQWLLPHFWKLINDMRTELSFLVNSSFKWQITQKFQHATCWTCESFQHHITTKSRVRQFSSDSLEKILIIAGYSVLSLKTKSWSILRF